VCGRREKPKSKGLWPLQNYSATVRPLPGLADPRAIDTLAMQFVASFRREDYYGVVQRQPTSANRADPNHSSFDAERAVAFYVQRGNIDEAAWLVFLMTHFASKQFSASGCPPPQPGAPAAGPCVSGPAAPFPTVAE
jgi:hypothetical protein